ncbi:MAG: Kdo hydroxylase family protein [Rhodocyclaceae bacterium]|nr:Kdo hydroxylase family protein [Rhodocyclaceae bacterium]
MTNLKDQIVEIAVDQWQVDTPQDDWITAIEAGKILYFPHLPFPLDAAKAANLFTPAVLDPKSRNISLGTDGKLKGAAGDAATQEALTAMVGDFRERAVKLVHGLFPKYAPGLRLAPTSYRPMQVATRVQSWRADDRRMHVDAFPSRPNRGERILRVFINVNPDAESRVWRVGEPFEDIARRFLPRAKPYSAWQAGLLNTLGVTKSLRSEYDHLMLQLHDGMKSDADYQQNGPQLVQPFPSGAVWVCYSDQTPHAVMSGQYMMEQTFHLPTSYLYRPESCPLAILTALAQRALI